MANVEVLVYLTALGQLAPRPADDISLNKGESITWRADGGTNVLSIEKIEFFEDQDEKVSMGYFQRGGSSATWPPHYTFKSDSDITWVRAVDTEVTRKEDAHWYRLWAKDANGTMHDFDPKVINKPGG